jgi:hypothetical protein
MTASVPLAYRFTDVPERGGIEVRYRNSTRAVMCLSPDQWPNQAGKLNQVSDRVVLIVDGKSFPLEDFNTGYCVGGCPTYVDPGEEIRGFIPYNHFALPPEMVGKPKQLLFTPLGYVCARSQRR